MPNGNLYDHPYSDVAYWHRRVFSVEMFTLLAEISTLGAHDEQAMPEELADRLLMADPSLGDEPAPEMTLAELQADVQELRDRLVATVRAQGVDVESVLEPIRQRVREVWATAAD